MSLAGELSHSEIQRLKGLGFEDWRVDENGVRIYPSKKAEYISFPKIAYEDTHLSRDDFWSRHRVEVLNQALDKHKVDLIWELGGGDGRMSIPLWERGKGVIAIEPHYEGCLKVAEAGIPIFEGTLKDLAIPHNSLHAVGFFDVLEHIENDSQAIEYMKFFLKPGGTLIILTPAYPSLLSKLDKALGHFRRYSHKKISDLVKKQGMSIRRLFHFNSIGVIAWTYGKVLNLRTIPKQEMKLFNKLVPIGKFFDRMLFQKAGLSIIIIAEKSTLN